MNDLIILNKDTYERVYDWNVVNSNQSSNKTNKDVKDDTFYLNTIQLIKYTDLLDSNESEYFSLKIDTNKNIFYRKSIQTKFSILIISDKNSFKRESLIGISKTYLEGFIKHIQENDCSATLKNNLQMKLNMNNLTKNAIEETTQKFIENLKKNKLYIKFVYYNFNPNVEISNFYKKANIDLKSVILHDSSKKYVKKKLLPGEKEKIDINIFLKSTLNEKDLYMLENEKKARPQCKQKIIIKKSIEKNPKNSFSLSGANSFIEKNFLSKNIMIHFLFNNIYTETENKTKINTKQGEKLNYPINNENREILLHALDFYDKAQSIFSVSKSRVQEYLDSVSYIELNLLKSDIMLKYKSLFIIINLEIYGEKNLWNFTHSNTNFYKEIESLIAMMYNEISYNQSN